MADLPANRSRFALTIDGVRAPLRVLRFTGEEALSQPYLFRLQLACVDPTLDFAAIIDRNALLTIDADGPPRQVHGIVERFSQGEPGHRFTLYELDLVPAIRRLHYRHNCRIFQQLSVPAIIDQVLGDAGLSRDTWRTSLEGRHPVREYCVQYRESELAFISRLMEEEGIFYSFEHHADHHVLVMADHPAVHAPIAGGAEVPWRPRHSGQISDRHIFSFNYAEAIRPGVASLRDYNFRRPAMDLTGTRRAEADRTLEVYDYPGLYDAPDQGNSLAKVRLEEWRVARQGASGESVCAQLLPGELFELTGFPRGDRNVRYLITRLITEGAEPQALEETAGSAGSEFHNRFECLPATVTFRPPRVTPKPRIQGSQTAIVVGPAGEEIYTDEYGRIAGQEPRHFQALEAPENAVTREPRFWVTG